MEQKDVIGLKKFCAEQASKNSSTPDKLLDYALKLYEWISGEKVRTENLEFHEAVYFLFKKNYVMGRKALRKEYNKYEITSFTTEDMYASDWYIIRKKGE